MGIVLIMEQQTQQYPAKKFAAFAFLGGMVVIGVIWIGSSVITGSGLLYRNSYSDSSYLSSSQSAGNSFVKTPTANTVVGNMTQDRQVTTNYLSVHVKDVTEFHNTLSAFVKSVSGKVMSENVSVSSDDQSESGTFTVLVPNEKAQTFLDTVGKESIKVVDRQVTSYQVTQQYTDIQRQLAQYEETYTKIQAYFDKAKSVDDLLRVQTQLDQVQTMIDTLKGQKKALDELSTNTQFTLYSSTNEYNLPYVPQGTFEVAKTFKLAVRSLVATTDKLVSGLIYVVVYVPLLAVAGAVVWVIKKFLIK